MLMRECLEKAPVTVPPQCTLREAATVMAEHDVGALLVMRGDLLVGIVTDRIWHCAAWAPGSTRTPMWRSS